MASCWAEHLAWVLPVRNDWPAWQAIRVWSPPLGSALAWLLTRGISEAECSSTFFFSLKARIYCMKHFIWLPSIHHTNYM